MRPRPRVGCFCADVAALVCMCHRALCAAAAIRCNHVWVSCFTSPEALFGISSNNWRPDLLISSFMLFQFLFLCRCFCRPMQTSTMPPILLYRSFCLRRPLVLLLWSFSYMSLSCSFLCGSSFVIFVPMTYLLVLNLDLGS